MTHPVEHVSYERGAAYLGRFERNVSNPVKQALTRAEEHWGDVQPQVVNETRRKVLTHNADTASDPNIPAASGLVGLGECGLDPLVTKVKVVPPFISIGSRAKLVRTNTGALYGGSAPHQPCQVESHAPRPGPNMLRPKIRVLQTVKIEIDSGEPLRMGSRLG